MSEHDKKVTQSIRNWASDEGHSLSKMADEEMLELLSAGTSRVAYGLQSLVKNCDAISAQVADSWPVLELLKAWHDERTAVE